MTKDISTNTKMEENKSTDIGSGSSPGTNPAVRGNIEDIWNETVGSPTKNPDRRRNGIFPLYPLSLSVLYAYFVVVGCMLMCRIE